jgi:TetR/AcrR family transcriptional repressor of mexJK operon
MCPAIDPRVAAKPNAPGRPKDLGKRAAILEAAKRLFVEQGYDGVSMDQIAAAAGVSKLTVYSHFGDKDALFAAAARAYCERQLPAELFAACPEVPLRERLLEIARAFYAMVSSPEAVAGHRILCTPQMADSPVPAMFWDAGPKRVQGEFAQLLQRRIEAGELEIDDVPRAASQFFALLKGDLHAQLVMGCADAACREVVREHVAASVDMFLRAYARRDAAP